MIVVVGHLVVAPGQRDTHLALSEPSARAARAAPGCRHFSVTADLLEAAWVDVAEVWENRAVLDDFRSSASEGEDDADGADPFAHVLEFHVTEHEV
jgi:quinol monooxygenase YgiN